MKIKIIRSFAVQQFSKVEFKDFELPKQKGRSEQPMRKSLNFQNSMRNIENESEIICHVERRQELI